MNSFRSVMFLSVIIIGFVFVPCISRAKQIPGGAAPSEGSSTGIAVDAELILETADAKKSIVVIAHRKSEKEFVQRCTGFFISVEGVYHIVTAGHCVFDRGKNRFIDDDLFFLLQERARKVDSRQDQGYQTDARR